MRVLRWFLFCLTVCVVGAALSSGAAWADDGPVRLRVVGTSGGEPVGFEVTNTGSTPCKVVTVPDGALMITSVVRDGKVLQPEMTTRFYPVPLRSLRHRAVKTLAPGASLRLEDGDESGVLASVAWSDRAKYLTQRWRVDQPGTYRVTARLMPPLEDLSAGACRLPVAETSSTFTVAGRPWLPGSAALLGAGVLVVLLLVMVAVLTGRSRRRRRRRWAGPYGTGVLLMLMAAGIVGVDQRPAAAVLKPSSDKAFQKMIDGCLTRIRAVGDPGDVLARIQASKNAVSIVRTARRTGLDGDFSDALHPETESVPGKGSPVRISWNPANTEPLEPGVPEDVCSGLFHELSHAADSADGIADDSPCGSSAGDPFSEVKATLLENTYRRRQHLPERTKYSKPLPSSLERCLPPDVPKPTTQPTISCGPLCGVDDGDPHLRTFDQRRYDLQAVGEFVLVRTADRSLEVQARQSPFPGSRTVSVVTGVAVKTGGGRVTIYLNPQGSPRVLVNGVATSLRSGEVTLPGGAVLHGQAPDPASTGDNARRSVTLRTPAATIAVSPVGAWALNVQIDPAPALAGKPSGLLGNFDGDPANDLRTKDGTTLTDLAHDKLYGQYANSWRVTDADTLFDYAPGQSTLTFTDRSFPDPSAPGPSPQALQAATAICRAAGITDPAALTSCAYDVAVTGQTSFADAAAYRTSTGSAGTPVEAGSRHPLPAPAATLLFSGTIGQAGQRIVYRLDGTAGQIIYFEGLDTCANAPNAPIRRYSFASPTGALVPAYINTCQDGGRLVLKETGTHTLTVYGDPGVTGPYRVQIAGVRPDRAATTTIGSTLTGTIDMAGAQDAYTFTASAGQTVTFHGEGTCPTTGMLRYTMYAPSGAYGEVAYIPACRTTPTITLKETGTYHLVVYADARTTGSYRLHLTR